MDEKEQNMFARALDVLYNARLEKYGYGEYFHAKAVLKDESPDSTYSDTCDEPTDSKSA